MMDSEKYAPSCRGPHRGRRTVGASRRRLWGALFVSVLLLVVGALGAGSASGATPAPGWTIDSLATASTFKSETNSQCLASFAQETPVCDAYRVTATNAGERATNGSNVRLRDVIAPGLTVKRIALRWSGFPHIEGLCDEFNNCGGQADLNNLFGKFGQHLCASSAEAGSTVAECNFATGEIGFEPIEPNDTLIMTTYVTVEGSARTVVGNASVTGGGATGVATGDVSNAVDQAGPSFGASLFTSFASTPDGGLDLQASDHPYEFTTTIGLNNEFRVDPTGAFRATSVRDVKDIVIDLPIGFLGSAQATPTCTLAHLSTRKNCPANTQVGQLVTEPEGSAQVNGPIYNLQPEEGVAAQFGFVDALKAGHVISADVAPTAGGYVLRATVRELPQVPLTHVTTTFFGDPATKQEELSKRLGNEGGGITPVAMFTNPTDCSGGASVATLHMDSWQSPGRTNPGGAPDLSDPNWVSTSSTPGSSFENRAVTGCNLLAFNPTLSAQPEVSTADSPTGLSVKLHVAQSEDPGTLATPPLKRAVVTLPPGLTVNPSSASGLGACSPEEIALGAAGAPDCPDASKIGTVKLTTLLLPGPLGGTIYLATPNENPFGSLLAAYIVVDDAVTGIVIKIPGKLELSGDGQITGTFDNSPQFPFTDIELRFFGGARGDLATPESCANYSTTSTLTPWSAPDSGPDATPADGFAISSGCVTGFVPTLKAGTANPLAGAYSPFTLSFGRADTEQEISGLSVSLPSGLLAKIAGVPLCPDAAVAQAASRSGAAEQASPSCPTASQVGSVQVLAGPGPSPFVASGRVFLTGPYKGAPYGLAVVVPALAGPFDLGDVVVRQALQVNPSDAHVTDVSDPFPTVLQASGADGHSNGFPLRLREVKVSIDRPNFTFNPTSCEPKAITALATSTSGALASLAAHFQAGGCGALSFKPTFAASTQAKTSKAGGAALRVKVTSGSGQANIAKVRVSLPKQLPSRLTTLQKACTDAVFNTNPVLCPAASVVGTARAVTPVLANPLTGPAYLVSHGGAAFPDLVIVLQGEGIVLYLDGNTAIKKGITTSTFNAVPDAPVSSFELTLPEGPHSVLAANLPTKARGSMCAQKLVMPTALTGQNGLAKTQATAVSVTGCVKHKAKKKKKAHRATKGSRRHSHGRRPKK
jgi:hypothetical protein